MKLSTIATALISAGVATIITAEVVAKQVRRDFEDYVDQRVQEELEASVTFLETTGKAEPTEEYQEQHRQLFGTKFSNDKPSLDEVANKHQKIRYDQIVKGSGYSSDDVLVAEDGSIMKVEGDIEVTSTLGDIHAISTEEFMGNESTFMQSSVTYYADGVVLDEQNELVIAHEDLIGGGVPPFGELSGEPHIVYLRNNKIRREYEVIQDPGNGADILAEPGLGGVT